MRIPNVAVLITAVVSATAVAGDTWEKPKTFKASELLTPDLRKGEHYEVDEGVPTEGFFYDFTLRTDFGELKALGSSVLRERVQETTAGERTEGVANSVLGVNKAARVWTRKLEVDPYSRNPILQRALIEIARIAAAGGIATKVVVPIPPAVGTRAMVALSEGRAVAVLPLDYVAWTSPAEEAATEIAARAKKELGATGLEMQLTGQVSEQARAKLQALGWALKEKASADSPSGG